MRKKTDNIIFYILIIGLIILLFQPWTYFKTTESQKPDINLKYFDARHNKTTINVETWLENTGDITAYNITVFIRCRSQNGTLLFENILTPSIQYLRHNETTTIFYSFKIDNKTKTVLHTIEIRWNGGMKAYLKEQKVRGEYHV